MRSKFSRTVTWQYKAPDLEGQKRIGKGYSIGAWDLTQAAVAPCHPLPSSV